MPGRPPDRQPDPRQPDPIESSPAIQLADQTASHSASPAPPASQPSVRARPAQPNLAAQRKHRCRPGHTCASLSARWTCALSQPRHVCLQNSYMNPANPTQVPRAAQQKPASSAKAPLPSRRYLLENSQPTETNKKNPEIPRPLSHCPNQTQETKLKKLGNFLPETITTPKTRR